TETLTSEVETTSTDTRCRSKTSKIAFRKPCANNIRVAATSMIVILFLAAIALKKFRQGGTRAAIRVPSQPGFREFRIYTGMFFCTAGSTVEGCSTFAPK